MEFFLVFNGGMKKKERVATGMKKFILKFDESIFFSWPLAAVVFWNALRVRFLSLFLTSSSASP